MTSEAGGRLELPTVKTFDSNIITPVRLTRVDPAFDWR